MKKSLALKNKKRMNKEMKNTMIYAWFWRPSPFAWRDVCKFTRYQNLEKALRMDYLIALKNFERGHT